MSDKKKKLKVPKNYSKWNPATTLNPSVKDSSKIFIYDRKKVDKRKKMG